jgi:hypothetical protein
MHESTNAPSMTQWPKSARLYTTGPRVCVTLAVLFILGQLWPLSNAYALAQGSQSDSPVGKGPTDGSRSEAELGSISSKQDPQSPVIYCSWAMASVGVTDTFEYGPDDNTSTALLESDAACKGNETTFASQTNNAQGLLHVQGNMPRIRDLELWAAVSHPTSDAFGTGDGTVSWIVLKPNGEELSRMDQPVRSCAGTNEPGLMWQAAAKAYSYSGTGVFAATTVSNGSGTGLWQACRQGQVRIFSARTVLPPDSPCGTYSISTLATVEAKTTKLTYGIDVLCPVSVILDSTNVHWNVAPGGSAVVMGDLDPTTTGSPTITNNGDGPVQVGLVFTPLRRLDRADSIAEFGAMLVPKTGSATGLSRLAANTDGWIPGLSSVICPGKSIPINLVVHAPADLAAGEYSGSVRVLARAGGRC